MYAENGSKNRSGGFNQLRLENKTVPVFVCSEAGVRCHVHLLDLYLCKSPPIAFKFYMKPLGDHVTTDPVKPWYGSQSCGENKLATMAKSMFSQVWIVKLITASVQRVLLICSRLGYLCKNALVTIHSKHFVCTNVLLRVSTLLF